MARPSANSLSPFSRVRDALAMQIEQGGLLPGTPLPSEREMAESFGVNRMTLRRVLADLALKGLVESRDRVGHFVTNHTGVDRVASVRTKIAVIYYSTSEALRGDDFYGTTFFNIASRAEAQHDAVVFLLSGRRPMPEILTMLQQEDVRGIITLGIMDSALIRGLKVSGLPVVSIDYSDPSLGIDSVVIDDIDGGLKAVSHLVALGHEHIGYIGAYRAGGRRPEEVEFSSSRRQQGYEQALRDAGIEGRYIESVQVNAAGAHAAVGRLLSEFPQLTALFVFGDHMVPGVLKALKESGRKVPEDFSIVGFGDNTAVSLQTGIALTTVRPISLEAIAVEGLSLMLERLCTPGLPPRERIIPIEVVIRESCASAPVEVGSAAGSTHEG